MIGMVLVTHGRLAAEFVAALEHIVGPQQAIAAICIGPDDDMEQRRREILESVARVENGDGVVLLTDMFGGTPSNLAISVLDRAKVEVIAGGQPADADQARPHPWRAAARRGRHPGPGGRPQIHQRRFAAPGRRPAAEAMDQRAEPAGGEAGAARRSVTIRNQRGLHARAAAKFVKLADLFDAEGHGCARAT